MTLTISLQRPLILCTVKMDKRRGLYQRYERHKGWRQPSASCCVCDKWQEVQLGWVREFHPITTRLQKVLDTHFRSLQKTSFCFEATPSSAQALLQAVHSGITPGGLRKLYGMQGIKPRSATLTKQINALPAVLSLWPSLRNLVFLIVDSGKP